MEEILKQINAHKGATFNGATVDPTTNPTGQTAIHLTFTSGASTDKATQTVITVNGVSPGDITVK